MQSIAKALSTLVVASLAMTFSVHAQQFTMKMSTPTINDVAHEWMKTVKAGVESRSGGRIKVEVYPANQLGQIPATIEGVAMGTIEFTFPAVGFLIGLEPRFESLDAAGLFDDLVHGHKVLADPDIRKRLATFGEAKGVEPLTILLNGPMVLVAHKSVRSVADFKGQKLRVPGSAKLHVEPMRKLGVSPLSMPVGDMLPAMQNRTIDGVIAGFTLFTAFKYYDIAKGATMLPGTWAIAGGLVSRRFMKSLGPELEAIVREEARKAESLYSTWGVEDVGRISATWQKNGGEIIKLPEAEAKAYLEQVTSIIPGVVNANPTLKADYDALLAAARKYR